jgi:hypothetical protein
MLHSMIITNYGISTALGSAYTMQCCNSTQYARKEDSAECYEERSADLSLLRDVTHCCPLSLRSALK